VSPPLLHRHKRHAPKRDPLFIGIAVLALLTILFAFSLTHSIPFLGGGGRLVHATFAAARQVNTKTPVRVWGVQVGKVESVHHNAATRTTDVAFRITDDKVRLHDDASAALRWRTVLGGNMELALDPGSPSRPLLRGSRIPLGRTRIQVELEDVTRAFKGKGVAGTRALLRELPKALAGNAAGAAIDALPDIGKLAPGIRAVRGERGDDLDALVRSSARAVAATERVHRALGQLVDGADRTLRVMADDRAQLAGSFQKAPTALSATTAVARAIDATLPGLDGLVADLRPGARQLGPALQRTRPTILTLRAVLRQAQPLVANLRPAVEKLADASSVGRRLLAALDPTTRRLADDLVPFLGRQDDDLQRPVYQLIGPTLGTLGAASGHYIGTGHILNFPVQPAENSLSFVPCSTFIADPTAAQKVRCDALNNAMKRLLGMRRKGSR
jgi:phospholipid/cholesterol/gamma-HCH transport system substrate-binding protein